ncbi:MAG: hypothetical protein ACI8X5_000489 [Planctomycetota bacterium]|jgi:hypothetical protein
MFIVPTDDLGLQLNPLSRIEFVAVDFELLIRSIELEEVLDASAVVASRALDRALGIDAHLDGFIGRVDGRVDEIFKVELCGLFDENTGYLIDSIQLYVCDAIQAPHGQVETVGLVVSDSG